MKTLTFPHRDLDETDTSGSTLPSRTRAFFCTDPRRFGVHGLPHGKTYEQYVAYTDTLPEDENGFTYVPKYLGIVTVAKATPAQSARLVDVLRAVLTGGGAE